MPSSTSVFEAKAAAEAQLGSSPKVQRWVLGTRVLRNDEVLGEVLSEAKASGAVTERDEILQPQVLCVVLLSFTLVVKVIRFTWGSLAETETEVEIEASADTPVPIVQQEVAEAASIQAGSKMRFMKNGHQLSERSLGQNHIHRGAKLHLIYSPIQEVSSKSAPKPAPEPAALAQLGLVQVAKQKHRIINCTPRAAMP